MTKMMSPSASLDSWREYFRREDSDIFGIIDHAIMVAAADFPTELKSKRSSIAELLFSCQMSRCIGCEHLELSIAGDEDGLKTVEAVGVGGDGGDKDCSGAAADDAGDGGEDEAKLNNSLIVGDHSYRGLSDEQEVGLIVDEIMRIKDIFFNKDHETNAVLLESLRKLDSMAMNVNILKETEIGKAVNGLRKHRSDKISKLSKALFREWKEMVRRWMTSPKDIAEGTTPESADFSVVDEQEPFPSPPHDLDMYISEHDGFDLSEILDCLDCDGNLRENVESKHDRNLQSERTDGANVVGRYNEDQQMSREGAGVSRPKKHSDLDYDEARRRLKQSREQQMVPAEIQRPPLVAEQKWKLGGPQNNKLNSVDSDAKFEFAKRKLQESYQQHENAKRQRTIKVLETIPKQSKPKKPQFKRPGRRF